jgi:hypothetical protein
MNTFSSIRLLLLFCIALCFSACATLRIAPPRPMTIVCKNISKADFVKLTVAELKKDNFIIELADEEKGIVEADRAAVFTGMGYNTLTTGPYAFSAVLRNDTITVNFETVRADGEGKIFMIDTWDENNASTYDKRHFEPILKALRGACR